MPIFGFKYPKSIAGVDDKILNPRNTWRDKAEYDEYLTKVALMFKNNFKRYEDHAS